MPVLSSGLEQRTQIGFRLLCLRRSLVETCHFQNRLSSLWVFGQLLFVILLWFFELSGSFEQSRKVARIGVSFGLLSSLSELGFERPVLPIQQTDECGPRVGLTRVKANRLAIGHFCLTRLLESFQDFPCPDVFPGIC